MSAPRLGAALLAASFALACGNTDTTVRLRVRIAGDERKTPLRNPGTQSTPGSDVDVLKLQVYNPTLGVSRESEVTNDFSLSSSIKVGALDVSRGPDWRAVLSGADRFGVLYALGRSLSFEVPALGAIEVPILFGIADDFATTVAVKNGIGPFASASVLPNGSVLLIGLAGARLHEPIAGTLCAEDCLTGDLPPPRFLHNAITLSDGKIFIAGGAGPAGTLLADSYLFDPANRSFARLTVTGFPARTGSAAALLNGKVLLAGGRGTVEADGTRVVLIDPATGAITDAPALPVAVMLATATTLPSGEVLVTGGIDAAGASVASAAIYATDGTAVKPAGSMLSARGAHTATLLADGYVFLFGGRGPGGASLATAEVFTPTGKFIAVDSANLEPRQGHAALRLDTDAVLIVGGQAEPAGAPDPARLVPALRFSPEREVSGKYAGTFVPIGQVVSRTGPALAALPDLSVIVVGGARPSLAADPSVAAPAGSWAETAELFTPCEIKGRACPR